MVQFLLTIIACNFCCSYCLLAMKNYMRLSSFLTLTYLSSFKSNLRKHLLKEFLSCMLLYIILCTEVYVCYKILKFLYCSLLIKILSSAKKPLWGVVNKVLYVRSCLPPLSLKYSITEVFVVSPSASFLA